MAVSVPLDRVSRAEARREFDRVMQTRLARVKELRQLLASNGVTLGEDEDSVQALNDCRSSDAAGGTGRVRRLAPCRSPAQGRASRPST